MRIESTGAAVLTIAILGTANGHSAHQGLAPRLADEQVLREYTGVYRWDDNAVVYLQMWNEFSGFDKPSQLVAFDESGDVRVLYPIDHDRFFTGAAAAVSGSVESRIEMQRDGSGKITALTWQRDGAAIRTARRVQTETQEDVRFDGHGARLAGTLFRPVSAGRHPAIILVHGSGAETRDYMLPFARFLVRRGIAVLGYDKRGVGGSSGDWKTASLDDLAGDVVAASTYLKTRRDIDPAQIGLLGVSQAGWIMPLAAAQAKELAFLISISGAAVSPAETTIDQTQNELTASGMKPQMVTDITGLMQLQYQYARTGQGWDEYVAAREKLAARMGPPPDNFPGTPDHPYWQTIRRWYFYDPVPTIRQLRLPLLALFGELDNNIVAEKNKRAWEEALRAGGHPDYTLIVLPRGNHLQFEARVGSNAEMPSLQRIVPAYFSTVQAWLAKRIRGLDATAAQ